MSCITIVARPLAIPTIEHRLGRHSQLLLGIRGKLDARVPTDDLFELTDDGAKVIAGQVRIGPDAAPVAVAGEHVFERLVTHAEDNGSKHLNETPVGVEREVLVSGQLDHALGDLVVEADVKDGVHHAGHRELRAGAARYQERVRRIPEFFPGLFFHRPERRQSLLPEPLRKLSAGSEVAVAGLGRDREPRRNRNPQPIHLAEVRPLAAKKATYAIPVAIDRSFRFVELIERVHPLRRHRSSS